MPYKINKFITGLFKTRNIHQIDHSSKIIRPQNKNEEHFNSFIYFNYSNRDRNRFFSDKKKL